MLCDDIDRNDPDLQDTPRCRHRVGDPDCMCDPDVDSHHAPECDPTRRDIDDLRAVPLAFTGSARMVAHRGAVHWRE